MKYLKKWQTIVGSVLLLITLTTQWPHVLALVQIAYAGDLKQQQARQDTTLELTIQIFKIQTDRYYAGH